MNGQRVAYWLVVTRADEQCVHVSLRRKWWVRNPASKLRMGERTLMHFEFDASGMGEDDILRASLSDALVYLGGGPDA